MGDIILSDVERAMLNVYESAFYWCPDEIYRRLSALGLVEGNCLTAAGKALTGGSR